MVFILARSISCKPSALWIPFQSSSHYVKSLSKYLPCALSCCTSNLLLRVVCALSPPQAGVKAQCVKSAGVVKLSASCSILLPFVWKSTRRETENGVEKQKGCSQVRLEKREKVNEAVEMSELPIEVWKSPEVLVLFFFFSSSFSSASCFVIRDFPHKYSSCSGSNCRGRKLGGCSWEEKKKVGVGGAVRRCEKMCKGREIKELFKNWHER